MTPNRRVRTIIGMKRPIVVSVVGVAAVIIVFLLGTAHIEADGAERAVDAGAYLLGILAALSLLLWRRQPLVMVGVVGAALIAGAVITGQLIGDARPGIVIAAAGWSLAAVFAGEIVSARRDRVHAERERNRLIERQAISDERLRIAQDL